MDTEFLKELANVIKKRRVEGSVGDLDYQVRRKDIRGQVNLDDATIRALIGYDGNASLNAQAPLFGGHVNFDANHSDAGNNYHLSYNRPIDNGDVNFDASRAEDGNRRVYLRFRKQF